MNPGRRVLPPPAGLALLAGALAAAGFLSLAVGPARLPPGGVLGALLGGGDEAARTIVLSVRLPRTLMALLAGLALSSSGVVFQALLKNPLADPYLLGVSSGAALGAVAALVAGLTGPAVVPLAAMAGAAGAMLVVYALATRDGGLPPATLILAGVIVSSFCSALVLFMNVLMEARQLQGALFWVMGNLSGGAGGLGWVVAPAVGLGLVVSAAGSAKLNLLSQGDDVAASLGVEVERNKRVLFLAACLMTGAVVSVSGLIGFVGLVVPHAARMLFGSDHRVLLPASALLGGAFLIFSDVVARSVLAPAELPVGVITALVGAPFFLALMRRRGRVWGG